MIRTERTALIVGASRGLGLGLVSEYLHRGWRVVATSRGRHDADLKRLAHPAEGRLAIEPLAGTDTSAIDGLKRTLAGKTLDVLFVSAGIAYGPDDRIAHASAEDFCRVMVTNAFAPLKIIEALGDTVRPDGVIVAMTSSLGSVAANTSGGYEAYRASKAALNTLLRSYAARHGERSVIAMHPGWVRTDMGGPNANVSVGDSARGMLEVIERRRGEPGCVYLDFMGKTIPW